MPCGCLCKICGRWTAGALMKHAFEERCHRCTWCHDDEAAGCGKKQREKSLTELRAASRRRWGGNGPYKSDSSAAAVKAAV